MTPDFWRDKKVLITGHTGFKGSWLSLCLQKLGAEVIGFALSPPTQPNLFEVARVAEGMVSLQGDIRNLAALRSIFLKYQPEIVIHMAAQSLVRPSYHDPVETYTTNVMGTVNLLEAVRLIGGVRVVVNVTSDKCYEIRDQNVPYTERDAMGGFDPYSSSKGCSELVTAAYRRSYFEQNEGCSDGVAVATARAGNVIGGGDWAKDRLISDLMSSLIEGRPLVLRFPEAVRHWQHILEPLGGYLSLAEGLWSGGKDFSGGWNFGPCEADARSVSWMAEHLIQEWGKKADWDFDRSEHLHETKRLQLDSSKALRQLNWSPKISLKTALAWLVEWYKAYQRKEDMYQLTCRQILRHQNLVCA